MFGAIAGLFAPFLPNVFGGIGKWFEGRQELARIREQGKVTAQLAKDRGEIDLNISEVKRRQQVSTDSGAILEAAYKHDTAQSNGMVEFVDVASEHCSTWVVNLAVLLFAFTMAIRAKVRPVLAFGAAFIWAHSEWSAVPLSAIGAELVSAIITFYFSDRAKNAWREYGVSAKLRGAVGGKAKTTPLAEPKPAHPVEDLSERP